MKNKKWYFILMSLGQVNVRPNLIINLYSKLFIFFCKYYYSNRLTAVKVATPE
jgi:hypothetical protein